MSEKKRLFLLDFACILPFGHNATAISYFKKFFSDQFDEVIAIVCKDLPAEIDSIENESRQLPYLYSRKMVQSFIDPTFSLSNFWNSASSVPLRKVRKKVFDKSQLDIFEGYAIKSYLDIFLKYKITHNDYFFFHSISYYEAVGILLFLKKVPLNYWPNIHMRFIGVFEFSNIDNNGKTRLYRLIQKHYEKEKALGISKLFLSAEVPVYAQKLSTDLAVRVSTTFYPPLDSSLVSVDCAKNNMFTIICPGAGRGDKGFFELREILYRFYLYYPEEKVRLVVQSINEEKINQAEMAYICQLAAIPYVEVLDHKISEQKMMEVYAKADLVLLPYSVETYKYRGSAVLQESISFEKPVLSYDGTGFSDLIKIYENGFLCKDMDELVHQIYRIKNNEAFVKDLSLVKEEYISDFSEIYSNLWSK